MSTILAYVDTETTGLDPRIHQPYEVCFWREDAAEPVTLDLPHTLENADLKALEIGGYFDRRMSPHRDDSGWSCRRLVRGLHGTTLVGCNPAFDAAMLTRFLGGPVWHYRHINVADAAMWIFNWDRPKGLADIVNVLSDLGYDTPEPDHSAEADVRATRAVYEALRSIRNDWQKD